MQPSRRPIREVLSELNSDVFRSGGDFVDRVGPFAPLGLCVKIHKAAGFSGRGLGVCDVAPFAVMLVV